jgi:hypothetical protein
MNLLIDYYFLCIIYCFYQLSNSYRKRMMPGGLGISPGLDALAIIFIGWALAPIDIMLTWIRLYKEAAELRRKNNKV